MIGLVLVTHGDLGLSLRSAMEHVVGKQKAVATVCVGADAQIEDLRVELTGRIADVDHGDGVVLLTDMFGGTPSNLAMSMMVRPDIEVIAGVNLPMLVKLAKIRGSLCLVDAVQCAEDAGRKYIASGTEITNATHPRRACG